MDNQPARPSPERSIESSCTRALPLPPLQADAPLRRSRPVDPLPPLVRLVARLEERLEFVTFEDVAEAASRARSQSLRAAPLADLLRAAVEDSILLTDLRQFFDRDSLTVADGCVYRVNQRHPLVQKVLFGGPVRE
ncbi:MAG: hypothetical protein IT305_14865 [Chloroflexi bacterium]|nr:hypothetical protein [Chloroflexota bacterium]